MKIIDNLPADVQKLISAGLMDIRGYRDYERREGASIDAGDLVLTKEGNDVIFDKLITDNKDLLLEKADKILAARQENK